MIEAILHWLENIGLLGLFAAMFLEGSSLPFPGIAVVLAYGYILPINYWNTVWVAAGMSFFYCLASLIPYVIGSKLEGLLTKRKGFQKAKNLFVRYGMWSVALTRPFGLGNYISYVAGVSKMKLIPYIALTFIGIYPWSYVMLLLGNYFNGSYEAFMAFYENHSVYVYTAGGIFIGMLCLFFMMKNKRNRVKTRIMEGGNDGA
ncbi:DedA family protein [Bacillus salitolerans]|uniref:DedA family protein n=1 Tax=Bacillus salitolerans TaxID=1437434 RepID=A0ABW4LRR7_9BACI